MICAKALNDLHADDPEDQTVSVGSGRWLHALEASIVRLQGELDEITESVRRTDNKKIRDQPTQASKEKLGFEGAVQGPKKGCFVTCFHTLLEGGADELSMGLDRPVRVEEPDVI
jgi:hypothetical protein